MNARRAQSELKRLRRIRGAGPAAHYLGLSYSEIARELSRLGEQAERDHPTGRRRGIRVAKSTFGMWAIGAKPVTKIWLNRIGVLLANHLTARLGQMVGVKIHTNSPWHVEAFYKCRCRRWHELGCACNKKRAA